MSPDVPAVVELPGYTVVRGGGGEEQDVERKMMNDDFTIQLRFKT